MIYMAIVVTVLLTLWLVTARSMFRWRDALDVSQEILVWQASELTRISETGDSRANEQADSLQLCLQESQRSNGVTRQLTGDLAQKAESLRQMTDKLRESESRFRSSFKSSTVGIALLAPDGRWLEVNQTLCGIVGYSESELLATSFQAITHPDDLAADLDLVHRLLAGELPHYEMEKRYRHKAGHFVDIHLSVSLVRDADGRPLHFVSMIQDITSRKSAEQERERFFSHSMTPMCICGYDGYLTYFNPALEATFGQTSEELLTEPFLNRVHPDDRERATSQMGQMIAGGQTGRQVEIRSRCKDGTYKWSVWDVVPCDDLKVMYAIGHDVTARHLAEEALAEAERFARATVDALSTHIAICDEGGVILATNKTWRDFAVANGTSADVGVGASYLDACDHTSGPYAEEGSAVAAGIRAVIRAEQEEFALEYPCHSLTERRWYRVRITRFGGEGPVRVVVSHENITVARLAAEELQKFVSLVENSLDFIGMATLDGNVFYTNSAARELVGLAPDQRETGSTIAEFYTETGQRVLNDVALPAVLTNGHWEGELQFRHFQTGRPIEMASGIFMVLHPDSGEPICMATVNRDITEQKRAEDELRNNERRMREQQNALVTLTRTGRQRNTGEGIELQAITEASCQTLGASRVSVWRYTVDRSTIRCVDLFESATGLHSSGAELAEASSPAYFEALASAEVLEAGDAISDPRTREFSESYLKPLGISAMLDAPIYLGGQVEGVVCHEYLGPTRQWSADERTFAVAVANLVSLAIEVEERQRLEIELRSKTAFLQAQTESTLDALLVVDEQQHVILRNQQFVEMWQLPQHVTDLPDDESTLNYVIGLIKNPEKFLLGVRELYANPQQTARDEIELNDGRVVDRFSAPVIGGDGHYYGRYWAFRDVTERIHNEEQRRLQGAALEAAANSIVITDRNGTIEWVNSAFSRMTGYSLEEARGQNPRILRSKEHPAEFYENLWHTILGGNAWSGEVVNRRQDGTLYPEEMSIAPVRTADGEISHFVAIKQDISARKEAEAELRQARKSADAANHAKSEFLANMSHEIRTPMNGIIGLTGLVLDTALEGEQRQYLDGVMRSAEALLSLINSILDFSKIEAGKLELERIDFNLRETLAVAVEALTLRAHSQDLELLYEVRPDVPDGLIGDSGRLWQVVINLVGNALKFTEQGEVAILVELDDEAQASCHVSGPEVPAKDEPRLDEAVCLRFTVRDTGIGIPAAKQATLFQPFTQADSSTTRQYGGTGLGLAISSQLVDLMGGRIWFESEAGRGSQFHFTASFGRQTGSAPIESQRLPNDVAGLRVLVVDDNATHRRIQMSQLAHWGMKPCGAESGRSALDALQAAINSRQAFDLILLDALMPEMDGFEVLRQIRALAAIDRPTILMLSSASQHGDRERAQELGAAAYLVKPIGPAGLRAAILTALKLADRQTAEKTTNKRMSPVQAGARPLHILLVEDNAVNQLLAKRVLEKAGHSVVVANNGEDALAAFEHEPFDLILMDIQMPVMDGFQATARIRQQEIGTARHQQIIAMTAHALKGDRELCLKAGMDGYVSKPIRNSELFSTIAAAVHDLDHSPLPTSEVVDVQPLKK